jgi:hypothetical protein
VRVLDRKIPSAKDSREFSRIVRLRELILAVVRMRASRKIQRTPCMVPYRCKFVPNVRRNYLKARGFPRDSGLVRNGSNPFPAVRTNFPARGVAAGTLAYCLVRICIGWAE